MTRRANDKRTRRYKAVRYAVIGLGHIARAAVLPGFRHAQRNSRLAALVSGEMKKLRELGRRHGVERLCGYDGVDKGEENNIRLERETEEAPSMISVSIASMQPATVSPKNTRRGQ